MLFYVYFTAFYRFQRKEIFNAYVTEVHTDCTANGFCTLISTAAKAELPIEKSLYNIPLNTESGCEVNFVEIIHDCIPRCVDLKFVFESHDSYSTDYLYLYLQVKQCKLLMCTDIIKILSQCVAESERPVKCYRKCDRLRV